MASVAQICNMALSHLGSEARVSSISPADGSVEAGHCATFYDQARVELLEPGQWEFALKRASLPHVDNVSEAWSYAYAKPSDCLRPLRILRPSATLNVFNQDKYTAHADDRDTAEFEIEGGVIYTNQPDAVLVYVRDVTDTTKFPPTFTSALSFMLAYYIAGPVIKGMEGVKIGDAMRQRALVAAEISASAGANASSIESHVSPSILSVRK